MTPSAGRVAGDRRIEGRAGAHAEPGLEDRGRRAPVAGDPLDEQLVAVVAADARDARRARCRGGAATTRTRCGLAAVRDQRGRRPGRARSSRRARVAVLAGEVAADPGLALGEERLDERLGPAPSRGAPRRDASRPRRAPGGSSPAGGGRAASGGACSGRSPPGRRATARSRSSAAGRCGGHAVAHAPRRRRRPGRSPVSTPSRTAGRPFTMTSRIPAG